jgi:GTP-binding protein
LKIEASFLRSAASASDLPRDGLAAIALVGRSNVGKSSLINSLVRQRIARTSRAPGRTRLANVYRVARGQAVAMYVIDLPGYGYASGGNAGFEEIVRAVLDGQERREGRERLDRQEGEERQDRRDGQERRAREEAPPAGNLAAILLVDSRHPGLANDIEAWRWLQPVVDRRAIVATKIDKLTRGERIRVVGQLESVFEHPVLPVSAVTGEGLDELWKLIDNLVNRPPPNSSSPSRPRRPPPPARGAAATAQALEKKTKSLRRRRR